jgi:hypothetical protein
MFLSFLSRPKSLNTVGDLSNKIHDSPHSQDHKGFLTTCSSVFAGQLSFLDCQTPQKHTVDSEFCPGMAILYFTVCADEGLGTVESESKTRSRMVASTYCLDAHFGHFGPPFSRTCGISMM